MLRTKLGFRSWRAPRRREPPKRYWQVLALGLPASARCSTKPRAARSRRGSTSDLCLVARLEKYWALRRAPWDLRSCPPSASVTISPSAASRGSPRNTGNMGFLRGLSPEYMRDTPAINDYLERVLASDPLFSEKGFRLLKEVAAVGYRNQHFEALPAKSAHRKMLAALWRESPVGLIAPGQRLMTMAALLHRDREGVALLPFLIRASGLDADTWIDRYLDAYLVPLLHCCTRTSLPSCRTAKT